MIARSEQVLAMLTNGKPIDQIVAESRWPRRNIEALARSQQMLIHPDTGVAYDPAQAKSLQVAAKPPRIRDDSSALQVTIAQTVPGMPLEQSLCVHDRLVDYGLKHSHRATRALAERVRKDLAALAAAAHEDRNRAIAARARRATRMTADEAQRERVRSAENASGNLGLGELAAAFNVDSKVVRAWCLERGMCGTRGVLSRHALDEYAEAHR